MDTRFVCLTGLFSAALSFSPAVLLADGTASNRERWDGFIEQDGRRIPMALAVTSGEDGSVTGEMTLQNGEQGDTQVITLENFAISGTKVLFNLKDQTGNPTFRGNISPDGTIVSGTYSVHGSDHHFEVRYVWPDETASASLAAESVESSAQSGSPEYKPAAAQIPSHTPSSAAQDQSEYWDGAIELPGQKLGVKLAFKNNPDGTISGEVSIPSQNASNVQVTDFTVNGFDLAFSIPNIAGNPTFKGTISDDGQHVGGTFTQNGQSFPFTLSYVESAALVAGVHNAVEVARSSNFKSDAAAVSATGASNSTSTSPIPSIPPRTAHNNSNSTADHWAGFINIAGQQLSIACNFTAQDDDSIAGTISIPQQGATGCLLYTSDAADE